jgi:hypothetical protein
MVIKSPKTTNRASKATKGKTTQNQNLDVLPTRSLCLLHPASLARVAPVQPGRLEKRDQMEEFYREREMRGNIKRHSMVHLARCTKLAFPIVSSHGYMVGLIDQ